jgi:hypothetical protein
LQSASGYATQFILKGKEHTDLKGRYRSAELPCIMPLIGICIL